MDLMKKLKNPLFKRDYIDEILKWLPDKEIIVLTGPRQSGKTSIMLYIIKYLMDNEKTDPENISFYDAEDPNIASMFSSGIETIKKELGLDDDASPKKYLFIDEAQYISSAGRILKYLCDHYGHRLKIFISGSSALEISGAFRESMTGRKKVFEILPLNFGEFIEFSGGADLRRDARQGRPSAGPELAALFSQYCAYGGYPGVALERENEKKKSLLNEIYSSYVRKDAAVFTGAENHDKFNMLVKYIAINEGQLFNVQSACRDIGSLSRPTMERYLLLLEGTFITKKVGPFYGNKNKELVKMGKVYFIDRGLRNAVLNNFNTPDLRPDAGAVLEGAALRMLTGAGARPDEIKFFRKKAGLEIDFIREKETLEAFEIKKNGDSFSEKPFQDFIKKYKPSLFTVVSMNKKGSNGIFNYVTFPEFGA